MIVKLFGDQEGAPDIAHGRAVKFRAAGMDEKKGVKLALG